MLAVMQRVKATLSIYQPDAFMFLSISRLHGKPCVKSATALPIQQSKAYPIALRASASVVSGAPASVRLLVPRSPSTPRIQRISAV